MTKQYMHQEFLLYCPYSEITIEDYVYNGNPYLFSYRDQSYNLFDFQNGIIRRGISLSELDEIIDTEDDFNRFVKEIKWIDELIIIDDRPIFTNCILKNYSQNTLKAYLYRINCTGMRCFITTDEQLV